MFVKRKQRGTYGSTKIELRTENKKTSSYFCFITIEIGFHTFLRFIVEIFPGYVVLKLRKME